MQRKLGAAPERGDVSLKMVGNGHGDGRWLFKTQGGHGITAASRFNAWMRVLRAAATALQARGSVKFVIAELLSGDDWCGRSLGSGRVVAAVMKRGGDCAQIIAAQFSHDVRAMASKHCRHFSGRETVATCGL